MIELFALSLTITVICSLHEWGVEKFKDMKTAEMIENFIVTILFGHTKHSTGNLKNVKNFNYLFFRTFSCPLV